MGPCLRAIFGVLLPTEILTLSASPPATSVQEAKCTSNDVAKGTRRCEEALAGALVAAHSWGVSVEGGALRHRIILATLHALMVTANDHVLTEAL